jgi:hypothetical protein
MARPKPFIDALRVRAIWANKKARAELKSRIKDRLGIDVTTIQQLIELFIQYAPQLLAILAEVIAMFSSVGAVAAKPKKPRK